MREKGQRTSALDVDVGLVELLDELGEALEVTVHCAQMSRVSTRSRAGRRARGKREKGSDS